MKPEELIAVIASGKDRQRAAKELAGMGPVAVKPVLDAMRSMSAPPFILAQTLYQMEDNTAVDVLLPAIRDASVPVQLSSIEALGYLDGPKAVQALQELLLDTSQVPGPRTSAAEALGNCGDPGSLPLILKTSREAEEDEEHGLAIACIVAAAKLGDHSGLPVILKLVRLRADETIRASAVLALRYVAGEGVFSCLGTALADKPEVRRAAVEALYYLGNSTVMEGLLSASSNRDSEAAEKSRLFLRYLTGDEMSEKRATRKEWWARRKKKFGAEACYRSGVPITLDSLLSTIRSDFDVPYIALDFTIYTGKRIGSPAWIETNKSEAQSRMRSEASTFKDHFEAGAVYKSGKKFDLDILMQEPASG